MKVRPVTQLLVKAQITTNSTCLKIDVAVFFSAIANSSLRPPRMPKLNGELDKRFILAILASFLLCNIVSWWLSDLLKRQNNRFKPTSDSCDSPAVSKSDRQPSNFASYALNLSLIIALICCQLCALSCWLAVLVPINSQWFELLSGTFRSLISVFIPIRARALKQLKSQPNLCAIWSNLMYYGFFYAFSA